MRHEIYPSSIASFLFLIYIYIQGVPKLLIVLQRLLTQSFYVLSAWNFKLKIFKHIQIRGKKYFALLFLKMRKICFFLNVLNFQLLDICREWLSKRLWISFHFTICTSDIMPLLSPFSMEQQRWIILRYGVCPSVKTIRREFRQKFDVPPFDVPGELAFYRIIKRFNTTNSTVPKSKKEDGGGRPMTGRIQHSSQNSRPTRELDSFK